MQAPNRAEELEVHLPPNKRKTLTFGGWEDDTDGEDIRKDSGCVRSRWVLQEIAKTKVHGDFFSATPEAVEVELTHTSNTKKTMKWPGTASDGANDKRLAQPLR